MNRCPRLIAESLIESELFGYAPGTLTGGRAKGAKGLIQQASGGTLFLDEIGDMPLHLQTRLLRVLAEGQVLPVGAVKPIKVDIRVLAATHCTIAQLIADGRFREDLFNRLNGATLKLRALKARADKNYLIHTLLAYGWPGNIRQLANILTFADAICEANEITVHHLPEECVTHRWQSPSLLTPIQTPIPEHTPVTATEGDVQLPEKQALVEMLQHRRWNISSVAKQLSVSRPTVYRRLKKYQITLPKDMLN